MQALLNEKIKKIVITSINLITLFFAFILLFIPLKGMDKSIISNATDLKNINGDNAICLIIYVLFFVNLIVSICSIVFSFLKIDKQRIFISLNIFINLLFILLANQLGLSTFLYNFLVVLNLIGYFILIIYLTIFKIKENNGENLKENFEEKKGSIIILFISFFLNFIMLLIPFAIVEKSDQIVKFNPLNILFSNKIFIEDLVIFIIIFMILIISYFKLIKTLNRINKNDFYKSANSFIIYNYASTIFYFVAGLIFNYVITLFGFKCNTISFVPFIIQSFVFIVFSYFYGKNCGSDKHKVFDVVRAESLVYLTVFFVLTICTLLMNVIKVEFTFPFDVDTIKINGFDILKDYQKLSKGIQLMAFAIFTFLSVAITLFITSISSFVSKSKSYKKIAVASIFTSVLFTFVIGTFGKYYQIAQIINDESIKTIINGYGVSENISYSYKVRSDVFIMVLVELVLLVVVLIRKPFTKMVVKETQASINNMHTSKLENKSISESIVVKTFDACPIFSELDSKVYEFKNNLRLRKNETFNELTLPKLVNFVVSYARDSRLHLFYTPTDIATFIAGLASSRLAILQGMSGTGKTSLPKIFMEAVMGNVEIVEVESSWRDKNELLGYYNEFSKVYTPKKFTKALYKAKLNEEIITFIVLDEMNLSRIEYYFSDFLSLMENEEDKREINLLNVKIFNDYDNEHHSYLGLKDDYTLKIPSNVYFIGTANKDESTFEISDKVYDRAMTMNFNSRVKRQNITNNEVAPKFISYAMLNELFENAKNRFTFNFEENNLIKEVEKILAPYNISFGNRVANQIETFVKVYCSCFDNPTSYINEAVEIVILNKIVHKLETKNIENKKLLKSEFERLKLYRCSEFVAKLNED